LRAPINKQHNQASRGVAVLSFDPNMPRAPHMAPNLGPQRENFGARPTASTLLNSVMAVQRRWETQRAPTAFPAPTAFSGQPQPGPSGPRRIATGAKAHRHRGHWGMPHPQPQTHPLSAAHTGAKKREAGTATGSPLMATGHRALQLAATQRSRGLQLIRLTVPRARTALAAPQTKHIGHRTGSSSH
jgi:hypothetical protein